MRLAKAGIALFVSWPGVMLGQQTRVVHPFPHDSLVGSYRIHEPAGKAVGLLVLLPGGAGSYNEFQPNGSSPSTLPQQLSKQQIVTIVPSADGWLEDRSLKRLDAIVAETLTTYQIPSNRVVVGGFSGGGTTAVRFAEFCAAGRSATRISVRGVFAVDAPLDLTRFWRGETLAIQRGADPRFEAEARFVLSRMREVLGGSPDTHPASYLRISPFSAFARGGGQARLLAHLPVRLYTEPDVQWWMTNRKVDYYNMNALDAAGFILQLQLLGNREAQLITTEKRGYRPDGSRHPHSWSILDEAELRAWILKQVQS
jgi:hypothetical protein